MKAKFVFDQNDGEVTKRYYAKLNACGVMGQIAVALFRAQKRSTAAKKYRGRRFKSAAYDVKSWSLSELVKILSGNPDAGINFGWKPDPSVPFGDEPSYVLYVDTPMGQVSFHSPNRGDGPDYAGEWDGQHASQVRIIAFCDAVFEGRPLSEWRKVSGGADQFGLAL